MKSGITIKDLCLTRLFVVSSNMRLIQIFLLSTVLTLGCAGKIELNSIDSQSWKQDSSGCNDYRQSKIEALFGEKSKLIGLSPSEIKVLLGLPNENEPYKRNQRFFIYYTGKGKQCGSEYSHIPSSLNIRFDAIDRANEVYLVR